MVPRAPSDNCVATREVAQAVTHRATGSNGCRVVRVWVTGGSCCGPWERGGVKVAASAVAGGRGVASGRPSCKRCAVTALLIGYARCSTDQQDLTAQRDGLAALGVDIDRVYVDHGLTGTNRERPGLREALAACHEGDTLVVTKLDRLAWSLPDARAIADELTVRQVRLNLGGSVYDPTDPVGRLLFNVLAMVAESDLIRLSTREGMKVAKTKGQFQVGSSSESRSRGLSR